jgi:hypothetical protein
VTVLSPSVQLRNRYDSYGTEINDSSISLRLDFPVSRYLEARQEVEQGQPVPALKTATGASLRRAKAFFASSGVVVEAVMTDSHLSYALSNDGWAALAEAGVRYLLTSPRRSGSTARWNASTAPCWKSGAYDRLEPVKRSSASSPFSRWFEFYNSSRPRRFGWPASSLTAVDKSDGELHLATGPSIAGPVQLPCCVAVWPPNLESEIGLKSVASLAIQPRSMVLHVRVVLVVRSNPVSCILPGQLFDFQIRHSHVPAGVPIDRSDALNLTPDKVVLIHEDAHLNIRTAARAVVDAPLSSMCEKIRLRGCRGCQGSRDYQYGSKESDRSHFPYSFLPNQRVQRLLLSTASCPAISPTGSTLTIS